MQRKQNGDFNVWNFRRFLFGVSPDLPTKFEFLLLPLDFYELELIDISSRHS